MRYADKEMVGHGYDDAADERKISMMNLALGGQNGYMPEVHVGDYEMWVNNSSYITQRVISIVLETPLAFKFYNNADDLRKAWVALEERGVEKVDGLTTGSELTFAEHHFGADGSVHEDVTGAKATISSVTKDFRERPGAPVRNLHKFFQEHLVKESQTQRPLVTATAKFRSDATPSEKVYPPTMWASTMLYIQPGYGHLVVDNAWLAVNHYPKEVGKITAKMDLSSPEGEAIVYSVPYTGIYVQNDSVTKLGQIMLDNLTRDGSMGIDPNSVATATGKNADIKSYKNGYEHKAGETI